MSIGHANSEEYIEQYLGELEAESRSNLNYADADYADAVEHSEAIMGKVNDVDSLITEASEAMGDDDAGNEFGKALVDHFPVEDGMPNYSDVRDFLNSWADREVYEDTIDDICLMMEQVYDVWGETADPETLAEIQDDVKHFVIAMLRTPSQELVKQLVDAFDNDGKIVSNHEAKVSLAVVAEILQKVRLQDAR